MLSPVKDFGSFRLDEEDPEFIKDLALGKEISIDNLFKLGEWVDITGTNKGKGFCRCY